MGGTPSLRGHSEAHGRALTGGSGLPVARLSFGFDLRRGVVVLPGTGGSISSTSMLDGAGYLIPLALISILEPCVFFFSSLALAWLAEAGLKFF